MTELKDTMELRNVFQQKGIVHTLQRDIIARTIFSLGKHVGAGELYAIINKKHPYFGLATVYRTLQLFKKKGLIEERDFGDGHRRYENLDQRHHDHLICLNCGNVSEFKDQAMEEQQKQVAMKNRFTLVYHKMEMYGYCPNCREFISRESE